MLHRVLDAIPIEEHVPEWVLPALAPLMPQTRADVSGRPDPRLIEAIHVVSGAAVRLQGAVVTVFEDLHEVDAATMAMLAGAFPLGQPGGLPHCVGTFRAQELDAPTRAVFERFVAAGQAAWIELAPLEDADVHGLVASLDLPGLAERGADFARFTGGNPLFVLETIKHLLEEGNVGRSGPLPVPERVSGIIARRLRALSTPALHAARAAAVLRSDFDVERVAEVLRAPLLDVAAAWEELEDAQVMVGERFSHDLLAETLRQETPAGVRRLLHRAAARALEAAPGAAAARVAEHWLAGGQGDQAAPWLVRAGHAAWQTARLEEAQAFFAQAADLRAATDPRGAFDALALRAEVLANMDDARHAAAVRDLHERAVTPLERATAFMQTYRQLEGSMDAARIEPVVAAGLSALRAAGDTREAQLVDAQLTEGQALIAFLRGQHDEALAHLRRLAALGERAGSLEWQAKAHEGLGLALSATAPREAAPHLERAEGLHIRRHDVLRAGSRLAKLARVRCELREGEAARDAAARGEAHLRHLDANHGERIALLFVQVMVAQMTGEYPRARALCAQARRDHRPEHSALLAAFPVLHAKTLRLEGRPQEALGELRRTREGPPLPDHLEALRTLEEAAILLALQASAEVPPLLERAQQQLERTPNVAWQVRLHDLWAVQLGAAGAVQREAARALRAQHGLPEAHWSAL